MAYQPSMIVVGGGIAGLMATLKMVEAGITVKLFSSLPTRRSPSVLEQSGINAVLGLQGIEDSFEKHFSDTIYGGDFLANQEPVRRMCLMAPELIYYLERLDILFWRSLEGLLMPLQTVGNSSPRTFVSGLSTGQQILYGLDNQVRRFEAEGKVERFEGWEFLSLIRDGSGRCRGMTAMDQVHMEIQSFPSDVILFCTGGCGNLFEGSTQSVVSHGSAASILYQQGAYYANPEFIQIYPTSIPGEDKSLALSELLRSLGGRLWVYKEGKPWYFLEEWYPSSRGLVPSDLASRALYKIVHEMGLGIEGKPLVYFDLTHLSQGDFREMPKAPFELIRKLTGEDPQKVPLKIHPAVHYSMGGLWVDENQMTNIPGVFAAGECDYQYHGANSLEANKLLSCLYGGYQAVQAMVEYAQGIKVNAEALDSRYFSDEVKNQHYLNQELKDLNGPENPFLLHEELKEWMNDHVTTIRYNEKLKKTDEKIQELIQRFQRMTIPDRRLQFNQSLIFARQLKNMLELARVITLGALARNESRGAHYKPEFPHRDDQNFLKTTKASWTSKGPKIEYEDVSTIYMKPAVRSY